MIYNEGVFKEGGELSEVEESDSTSKSESPAKNQSL